VLLYRIKISYETLNLTFVLKKYNNKNMTKQNNLFHKLDFSRTTFQTHITHILRAQLEETKSLQPAGGAGTKNRGVPTENRHSSSFECSSDALTKVFCVCSPNNGTTPTSKHTSRTKLRSRLRRCTLSELPSSHLLREGSCRQRRRLEPRAWTAARRSLASPASGARCSSDK